MGLFGELKRRNVFRVGIAYVIVGWLVIQVADIVLENIGAPDWVMQALMLMLGLGFVVALFFAWAFEVTPDGIKRESEVDRSQSITGVTGRKLDRSITVFLVIALVYFVWESRFADRSDVVEQAAVETVDQVPAEMAADVEVADSKSIAVLPFDNRSSREEDEFFTEGIHDDLLTTIAKIGSMKVISRTSVMEYKDTTKNIRDIARELGVANILEGGIQRSGNQVRINVQLIDAVSDEHLWAEIYDRKLTAENLFAIQSEISKAIADALQATLSPEDQEKVNVVHTRNLEAYESYLHGRKLWKARTAESNAESIKYFQRAVDLDPAYALAYVGLSDAYRFRVEYEGVDPGEVLPLAERALQTALQLNDQLGEAYASRGAMKRNARDYDGAEVDFLRAIELSPNHLPSYNWYAISLGAQGRVEEEMAMYEKGLELDPLSAVIRSNITYNLAAMGRFDEARKTTERIIEMHPDESYGYSRYAGYQAGVLGRMDDALVWQSKAIQVDPSNAANMSIMAFNYLSLGDFETAEKWIDRAAVAQPHNRLQKIARLYLLLYRDEMDEVEVLANELYEFQKETGGFGNFALTLLRDIDIGTGQYDDSLQRYASYYPEIASADSPNIHRANYFIAVDFAYLLIRSGKEEQGRQLLQAAISQIDPIPILSLEGSWWGNARTYALLDRKDKALAELQRGVDAGWRILWRYAFDHDPLFDSLRDEPEFIAMRAKIATDMAEQLERVRKLEASGEILWPDNPVETSSLESDSARM